MPDPLLSSVTQIALLVRTGQASAEEVARAHLERIAHVNAALNAVVWCDEEKVLQAARAIDNSPAGPEDVLRGVPLTIKDSFDTAGIPSSAGTTGRAGYIPAHDATAVMRLKQAGAIVLGKTNTPELTQALETDNAVFGRTQNPYDLARSPGGSSGGEAAIIAVRGSPGGIGSDTGGSIRLPAHWCGIAGLKPTAGRIPRTGHTPGPGGFLDSLTVVGPLARHVEDLALLLRVLAGPDFADPSVTPAPLGSFRTVRLAALRIAFHTDNGVMSPTEETAQAVRQAADTLAETGAAVEEARPDGIEDCHRLFGKVYSAFGVAEVRAMLQAAGTAIPHPFNEWALRSPEKERTASELLVIVQEWDSFRMAMLRFMSRYDLIVCPVNSFPALPHGFTLSDRATRPAFSYTQAFNLTAYPAVVVRIGTSPESLPIGVQVIARPYREDVALAAAHYLEQSVGPWPEPGL